MKYLILAIILLPSLAFAEPFPIQYDEPSGQAGALAQTCIYWCACVNSSTCACTNWKKEACIASDDGNGGDTKNYTFNVPIYEGDLPVTVRYSVTSVNTTGNETMRGQVQGTPHTFTP